VDISLQLKHINTEAIYGRRAQSCQNAAAHCLCPSKNKFATNIQVHHNNAERFTGESKR
jgi:DTW domain-containing protein YfiP